LQVATLSVSKLKLALTIHAQLHMAVSFSKDGTKMTDCSGALPVLTG